ncbi:UV DNA damage repair endonuclease UvsE [Priestia endophytica]|jgi:UV DNA damage endonuclease|uniref:UV-damage endonuclease n=1 Tax=Priestia endophytica DSM 13796 TaxID=1121089 RepID=A0A1I6BWX3_9BACI|nr:UV DNA damage repair endonuclease UvsE [Priestia endophytica]KYG33825.1 UV damage endonuclease UvdE [Priestia endophytica]MBG9812287.1 UV damage repair endonuclease UvdE [Priestia endophytica]SFQ85438.1 UV-damage endonuclease [Priestia endophytica DSM 13796]
MTKIRLGYVAMSMELVNSSPSQTMTYANFKKIGNREAAIRKLERIAISNLENCLRLLKHNLWNEVEFFRLSSRLIPLAGHEDLSDWDYMKPLKPVLSEIKSFLEEHPMRIDFHPDHFVLLNSTKPEILKNAVQTLTMHARLLKGMGIPTQYRCVLHVGGAHKNKERALEQFIHNWALVPKSIAKMVMLENDDTTFNIEDVLYLCEKIDIPFIFDLHHHLANNEGERWEDHWERMVGTWAHSPLPMKMHISSPRSEEQFRAHAPYVDPEMFIGFLRTINGTIDMLDCMIEAKQKDKALEKLMRDLSKYDDVQVLSKGSFEIIKKGT